MHLQTPSSDTASLPSPTGSTSTRDSHNREQISFPIMNTSPTPSPSPAPTPTSTAPHPVIPLRSNRGGSIHMRAGQSSSSPKQTSPSAPRLTRTSFDHSVVAAPTAFSSSPHSPHEQAQQESDGGGGASITIGRRVFDLYFGEEIMACLTGARDGCARLRPVGVAFILSTLIGILLCMVSTSSFAMHVNNKLAVKYNKAVDRWQFGGLRDEFLRSAEPHGFNITVSINVTGSHYLLRTVSVNTAVVVVPSRTPPFATLLENDLYHMSTFVEEIRRVPLFNISNFNPNCTFQVQVGEGGTPVTMPCFVLQRRPAATLPVIENNNTDNSPQARCRRRMGTLIDGGETCLKISVVENVCMTIGPNATATNRPSSYVPTPYAGSYLGCWPIGSMWRWLPESGGEVDHNGDDIKDIWYPAEYIEIDAEMVMSAPPVNDTDNLAIYQRNKNATAFGNGTNTTEIWATTFWPNVTDVAVTLNSIDDPWLLVVKLTEGSMDYLLFAEPDWVVGAYARYSFLFAGALALLVPIVGCVVVCCAVPGVRRRHVYKRHSEVQEDEDRRTFSGLAHL